MKIKLELKEIIEMWSSVLSYVLNCILVITFPIWIIPYLIYKKVKGRCLE